MSAPGRAWALLAAAAALAALAATALPAQQLDWQPALAACEPWRAFSGALVHWSAAHLGINLLGALVVAALGLAARLPAAAAAAWACAWPLTQAGLLLQPALAHYGGLSGVLHAGVAVAALWLLLRDSGRRRALGGAIALGLAVKLWAEEPLGPPLRLPGMPGHAGWDIATAPLAHLSGALAGLACAAVALALDARAQAPGRRT